MVLRSGFIVIAIVALIILFATMVLCFVVMSELDKNRFAKLYNIALGSGVVSLILWLVTIITFIVLAVRGVITNYTTSAFVFGIIFGVIILIVGVLLGWIAYSLATDPLYNTAIPDDIAALRYALIGSGVAIATAILLLFAGLIVFLSGTDLLCYTREQNVEMKLL